MEVAPLLAPLVLPLYFPMMSRARGDPARHLGLFQPLLLALLELLVEMVRPGEPRALLARRPFRLVAPYPR